MEEFLRIGARLSVLAVDMINMIGTPGWDIPGKEGCFLGAGKSSDWVTQRRPWHPGNVLGFLSG